MAAGFRDRIGFFGRSLLLQGSWGFRQMQGLGFFVALEPWLRKAAPERFAEAARRHLGFFNTHPYMASYILGVVARREEAGDALGSLKAKESLMGPLGAAGDSLFWGGARPFVIVLTLFLALYAPFASILFMLAAYNALHVWARWHLFDRGYAAAGDILAPLEEFRRPLAWLQGSATLAPFLGFIVGAAAARSKAPASALLLFALALTLHRRGRRSLTVLLPVLAAAAILGALGVRMALPW